MGTEKAPGHSNQAHDVEATAGLVQARDVQGGVHFHGLREFSAVPRQLPAGVGGFVDRAREQAALDRLADPAEARVCLVTGPGGVGKTALVLHWAHRLVDAFPHGQLYLNLRTYSAVVAEFLDQFLRALGVPAAAIPPAADGRAGLYRSILATRAVLVVLDNADTAAQVRPLLPGAGRSRAVVVSRDRLAALVAREGAYRVDVPRMPEPDAVELLTNALHGRADSAVELIALARACVRLPLALRIAAERAASRPRMALTDLISDLHDESTRWELLMADEDAAVHAVFASAYAALPEPTARLFRLLGLHPTGQFGALAAAALAAETPAVARRQLDVLIDAHLVEQPASGRYGLHDLLHAYSVERSRDDDTADAREAVLDRLLAWYLHTADAAQTQMAPFDRFPLAEPVPAGLTVEDFADYDEALAWYRTERPALVAITRLAAESGRHIIAWQLAAVLRAIYMHQNAFDDWIATATLGVESARHLADQRGEAEALESLARAYFQSRRLSDAEAAHTAVLALRETLGDQHGMAVSTNALGLIALRRRRFTAAAEHFAHAQTLHPEPRWAAVCRSNLAETHCELHHYADAKATLHELVAFYQQVGEHAGEGNALFLLSWALRGQGQHAEAREAITGALALATQDDNPVWRGHWLTEAARVELAAHRPAPALTEFDESADLQRRLGDRNREAYAEEGAGTALAALDRPDQATARLRYAAAIHGDLGDDYARARCLAALASLSNQAGRPEDAHAKRAEAAALLAGYDDPDADALRANLTR